MRLSRIVTAGLMAPALALGGATAARAQTPAAARARPSSGTTIEWA